MAMFAALTLAGCGQGPQAAPEVPAVPPRLASELDREFERQFEDLLLPGAASVLIVHGELVWKGAAGMAVVETGVPMTPETPVALASVSKPITTALALRMQEQGLLSLDDSLRRHVPEFRGPRSLTLRMLLGHRSGIRDPAARFYDSTSRRVRGPLEWLRRSRVIDDRAWHYDNVNFILAGLAMRRAAGGRWDELRRSLGPGLYLQNEDKPPSGSAGYVAGSNERFGDDSGYLPSRSVAGSAWTAGGWAASAVDVARFAQRLFEGKLLRPQSLEQMTKFQEAEFGGYGLGLGQFFVSSEEVWAHAGDIDGFRTELAHVPARDMTLFTVWNTSEMKEPILHQALLQLAIDRAGGGR
jgi:D-alanyl-D-alanine carboxypeptidase